MKHIKLLRQNNFLICFFISLSLLSKVTAQDIKSTYLQVKYMSGYKYSGDLYLLTNLSTTVFRPYVLIDWGPQVDTLKFVQSTLYGNTVVNKFNGNYTYPGAGIYTIIYKDKNRVAGIKNILNSQSEFTQVTTTLNINPFNTGNFAPTLQNYPIYFGKSGNQVFFNPNFTDQNGDSLSFSLVNCYASNYYLPSGATINPTTGVVQFSKDSLGLYAFSYLIDEWRKGSGGIYSKVGATEIDFVIDITNSIDIKELENLNGLNVYPNPVLLNLFIQFDGSKSNSTTEIINSLGQTVLKLNYSSQLDVSELSAGCYIIQITTADQKKFYSKFIKE